MDKRFVYGHSGKPRKLGKRGRNRCGGKVRYRDENEATLALHRCQNEARKGRQNRKEQRPYPCDRCNGWHLTSQPKRLSEEPACR